jgi:glucosamine-6-phosphate deaminase
MMFAAAPSQLEFLEVFRGRDDIPWERVIAFHMDEYVGVPADAPFLFGPFLRRHLFDHRPFGKVHYLNPVPSSPQEECARYSVLLEEAPMDIICLGIGENGHLAFNDPPVADFHDPLTVKVVQLDHACRVQQAHDAGFRTLDDVPTHAMTVTLPALMKGRHLSVVVPGPRKARAVLDAVEGPLTTACPASILRYHQDAVLYLDDASAALLSRS